MQLRTFYIFSPSWRIGQASHHHHHHGATAISDKDSFHSAQLVRGKLTPLVPSIQERAGPQSGQSPSHKDAVAIPQNVDDGEQGLGMADSMPRMQFRSKSGKHVI